MINEENFKILSVPNAGIVLISSLFPPLFEKLGMLDRSGNSFKDIDSKIHAIFVIQYLVNKKYRNISANDLELNGLLVDYTDSSFLSTDYKLSDGEIEIIDEDNKLSWRCPQCGCEDQHKLHVSRRTCGLNLAHVKLLKLPERY